MKKNLLFGMFAAAGLLLAASCQNDALETAGPSGNEAVVTFNLVQSGISTRAVYSDGLTATTLTYAVYEEGYQTPLITNVDDAEKTTFVDRKAAVTFRLVSGKSYDVIFWADCGDDSPYTFDAAAQTISVSYEGVASQDESRDAFYAHKTLTSVEGTISETIELKRPFAQLNIGTTDYADAKQAGFAPTESTVTVSEVYSTLNLLDDTVADADEVTFAMADFPAETETFPVDGIEATYMSMNYLLVAAEKALVDVDFTVDDGIEGADATHSITREYTNVPVRRNYRTNIYGYLLTDEANFTVVIVPEYTDEYEYPSTGEEELLVAAANGGTVTLEEDVVLDELLTIAAGKSVVIDLADNALTLDYITVEEGASIAVKGGTLNTSIQSGDGVDITLEDVEMAPTAISPVIQLGSSSTRNGGGTLTITGSTISNAGYSNVTGIIIQGADNKIVIEDTEITHTYFGITQNGTVPGSDITLNNVTISGTYSAVYLSNKASGAANTLTINGGSYHSTSESAIEVKKTNLTIDGATLSSDVTTQAYSFNGSGSGAEGYGVALVGYTRGQAYDNDGTTLSLSNIIYNLAAEDAVNVGKYDGSTLVAVEDDGEVIGSVEDLTAALADETATEITLGADLTISSATSITSDKTIDLNGNTLTASANLTATEGTTLTIQDGTITATSSSKLVCSAGGSIEIDNVTYTGTGWNCVLSAENAENTTITIKNSYIESGYYGLSTNATTNPVGTTTMILENSTFVADETAFLMNVPSTVTATGCTFEGGWQAVFLRGGTSTFEDCAFNLVMDSNYGDLPEANNNANGTWKSGNQAVTAALLIGNRGAENSTAYDYPTTVTLSNCTFSVSGSATNGTITLNTAPSVYVWSRVETDNPTTLNYDAASYTSFQAAGSGSYVGNSGTNLYVNGSAYEATEDSTSLPAVE